MRTQREKDSICSQEGLLVGCPLLKLESQLLTNLNQHQSRDTGKNPPRERRRANRSVLNPKQVAGRGFHDLLVGVHQQRLIGSASLSFCTREDLREFIAV